MLMIAEMFCVTGEVRRDVAALMDVGSPVAMAQWVPVSQPQSHHPPHSDGPTYQAAEAVALDALARSVPYSSPRQTR